MQINQKLSVNDKYVMLCVWFAAFVSLLSESVNAVALYIVLPSAFIATFFYWKKIQVNKYFNLLLLLYLWIFISVLWATDTAVAFRQLKQCLGSILLCYVFAVKATKIKNIEWIYFSYFIVLAMDWYYAYNNIFSIIEVGTDRLNDSKFNANTLAYHTFYVTFATYILGEVTEKKRKKIYNLLFLFTMPLSFYTALLTASRQVLIIQIPLISILLFIRYLKDRDIKRKFIVIFILIVAILSVLPFLLDIYADSTLKSRNEIDLKEDSRITLAKDALNVGIEYFPLGVGPDNYLLHSYNKHFSHNTYLELFANEGVIGLFIYLLLMFRYVKTQWKRYEKYKDKIFLAFFIFGVFFIIDGLFYSFYQHLWLISFFIIVASHSETYNQRKYLQIQKL